jgi:hypothetical protein
MRVFRMNYFYPEGGGSVFLRSIKEDNNLSSNLVAFYVEAVHTAMATRRNVCLSLMYTRSHIYITFQNVFMSHHF